MSPATPRSLKTESNWGFVIVASIRLLFPMVLGLLMVVADLVQVLLGIDTRLLFHAISTLLVLGLAVYAATLFGYRFLVKAFGVLFVGGLAIEVVGTRTGLPFGEYGYTDRFQPQIFDIPIQIPVGWVILGLMCYALASLNQNGRVKRVVLAAALTVAWDFLYDPVFTATGIWVWRTPTYFGVAVTNFPGWLIASMLLFTLLDLPSNPQARYRERWAKISPLTLYVAYIIDGSIQNIVLNQMGAAIFGALVMMMALFVVHVRRPLPAK